MIDWLVSLVSPERALKRHAARQALLAMQQVSDRSFDAAQTTDRLRGRKAATAVGPWDETSQSRSRLATEARQVDANNGWATGIFNAIADNVVGEEIGVRARAKFRNGRPRQRLNQQIDEAWARFADSADPTTKRSFGEMLWHLERDEWVVGEGLFLREAPDDSRAGAQPLVVRYLEDGQLDDRDEEREGGGRIVQGVEFDAGGRIVAYWIFPNHPLDDISLNGKSRRVDANRVIHSFSNRRGAAVRGITRLAPVMTTFMALAQYFDFELTRARIASAFVAAITKPDGGSFRFGLTGDATDKTDDDGNDIGYLEAGMIARLRNGEDIKFGQPSVQSTAFEPFVVVMLRSLSAALNVSYELLARDFTKATFSSARQGSLEDRKHWRVRQSRLVRGVCRQAWEWFTESLLLTREFRNAQVRPEEIGAEWQPQGWSWIDPQKEVKAEKEAIRGGLKSPQQCLAERGRDWRKTLEQIAEARDEAEALGVSLDVFGGEASPQTPQLIEEDADAA